MEYICKFCVQKEDGDKANVRWRVEITNFKKEAYEKVQYEDEHLLFGTGLN